MCTASFITTSRGYVLATNRDERRTRGAGEPPAVFLAKGRKVLAPRDSDAGGTWVAVREDGAALCILNHDLSGNVVHRADAPSRGRLLLDLVDFNSIEDICEELRRRHQSRRMRENAFRLLAVFPEVDESSAPWFALKRVQWDGNEVSFASLPRKHVEVSSGFDQREAERRRTLAFAEFLSRNNQDHLVRDLVAWHRSHAGGDAEGDALSVCMHHEVAHSVSCTLVVVDDSEVRMNYWAGQPCQSRSFSETTLVRSS